MNTQKHRFDNSDHIVGDLKPMNPSPNQVMPNQVATQPVATESKFTNDPQKRPYPRLPMMDSED